MLTINFRRIFLIASALSLAIIYILLWLRMLNDPVQYTGTDFVPFYAAAQIASNEGPGQTYNLNLQKKYEEELIGFKIGIEDVNIFVNPPFVIPLTSLVFTLNFRDSLIFWEIIMGGGLLTGIFLLLQLMQNEIRKKPLLIFILGLLLFFPAYKSLLIGQNSTMLFFGACLWLFGLLTHKDWVAGFGLALMTVRPHIALPLVLPFIFKRRRVFWWFLIGAGILAVFSLFYAGMDGILGFLKMLTISATAANTTVKEQEMVNLIGLMIRAFPNLSISIIHWVGWSTYIMTIIGLCLLWIKSPEIQGRQIGLAVLVTTFTTPHLHMHDLVLWGIPMTLIMLSTKNNPGLINKLAALPWWLSMAFLFCFFSPVLAAVIPYLILVFLITAMIIPDRVFSLSIFRSRSNT